MTDEITVLKPTRKPKILTAHPSVMEALPQIKHQISFRPFLKYLKKKRAAVTGAKQRLYNYLIKKFESEQELLQPITDLHLIDEHAELMELLVTSLFPVVCHQEHSNFALAAPYQYSTFYYSDEFRHLFFDKKEQYFLLPEGLSAQRLKTIQCASIYDHVLEKFYGMNLNDDRQLVYPLVNAKTGMTRYYKIKFDRRFIDLHVKGELPNIQDCPVCQNTFRILDLEKQLEVMPLHLFEAEGFGVWTAEDISTTESLEIMKRTLLRENCGTETMQELKAAIKTLTGRSDLQVGLMPFVKINGKEVLDEASSQHSLVCKQWLHDVDANYDAFQHFLEFLKAKPDPTPVSNVTERIVEMAPAMAALYEAGIRSYIYYPICNNNELIGYLELASTEKNSLTQDVMLQLEPAIPLISLAVMKGRNEFNNRIEKIIREKFTALQQSVEWKFTEVAWDHLRKNEKKNWTKNVVFEDVYPLYGAIDIRNSSLKRSQAIQKDLKEHLVTVAKILTQLQTLTQLPLLEELEFKNENIRQSVEESMTGEDEMRINEFLSDEVEPLFLHLQKTNSDAQNIVDAYFKLVNKRDSLLYCNRCEYEASVDAINNALLSYWEEEEAIIQKSYPHYVEKYRTDGMEYNIYIGQSIAPEKPFDLFYLKNIRLWQLKTMAGAARVTQALLPSLKMPLQTTQLILIHGLPITIGFRRDEHRFDVEGSYNIRYEIIKKRLDKVHIKDTNERLTQPGKIALVYSNQKEAAEYEEYIRFLQKKNVFKPEIEMLELEELQGVKGLKAMRVEINMDTATDN